MERKELQVRRLDAGQVQTRTAKIDLPETLAECIQLYGEARTLEYVRYGATLAAKHALLTPTPAEFAARQARQAQYAERGKGLGPTSDPLAPGPFDGWPEVPHRF